MQATGGHPGVPEDTAGARLHPLKPGLRLWLSSSSSSAAKLLSVPHSPTRQARSAGHVGGGGKARGRPRAASHRPQPSSQRAEAGAPRPLPRAGHALASPGGQVGTLCVRRLPSPLCPDSTRGLAAGCGRGWGWQGTHMGSPPLLSDLLRRMRTGAQEVTPKPRAWESGIDKAEEQRSKTNSDPTRIPGLASK